MITNSNFSTVLPFAQELASKGHMLSPVPGSILANLCAATHPSQSQVNTSLTSAEFSEIYLTECSIATERDGAGIGHTDILFNATQELSKLVIAHVSHVKNSVLPIVESMRVKYMDYLEKTSLKDPGEDFEIRGYVLPELVTNPRFEDLYSHRKDEKVFPAGELKLSITDKQITNIEDIAAMLALASTKANDDIKAWVELVSPEWVVEAYNEAFVKGYIGYEFANPYQGLNCGILLSLVGLYLEKQNPNSPQFINIKEFGFDLVYRNKKAIDFSKAGSRLIIEINQYTKTISVDNELYTKWLEAGNVPEVLLGALVSGYNDISFTVPSIDEKREKYLNNWRSYCSYSYGGDRLRREHDLRTYIRHNGYQITEDVCENEKLDYYKTTQFRTLATSSLEKEVAEFTVEELEDPFLVAVTIVGKCIYHKTCAYEFLKNMHQAAIDNKEIERTSDARAAATVATIRYLCEYVFAQMTVKKVQV